ncbi:putative small G-protein Ras2 [Xylaria bambusicola]|uniref:putative small G-protein Ras2 n=1 Tax=Xylaria bambusicola TaxID=326684 RepID=UPI002008EA07|nr:putative small G-protein Ras2 [Xylaria bambusicola]KAI0525823.1 putative small G-protein Ras2 [Xylaria bambusicola]
MAKHIMHLWPLIPRIVVLGDSGVGKTALINQLCHQQFVQTHNPTIEGSRTRAQIFIDDQSYPVEVLDTAGTLDLECHRNLKDGRIQKNDGIVLVYDVTSRKSFDRIEYLFRRVLEIKSWGTSDSVVSTETRLPIMIVGNKSDKVASRIVSPKEGAALARKLDCMFVDTSAKEDQDVLDSFYRVVKVLVGSESPRGYTWTSLLGGGSGDGCCIIM